MLATRCCFPLLLLATASSFQPVTLSKRYSNRAFLQPQSHNNNNRALASTTDLNVLKDAAVSTEDTIMRSPHAGKKSPFQHNHGRKPC